MSQGRVENLHQCIKDMAVGFHFKPGERINEVTLARELNVSRTPLREALNRLVAEQFFIFRPGHGFYCRELDARSIFELYEARAIVENAGVRQACTRASADDIKDLRAGPLATSQNYAGKTIGGAVADDEAFHIAIVQLAGNSELVRLLRNINERIRFIRWIDMAARVRTTKKEHDQIVTAMENRDADGALERMDAHISKRMDQIVAAVREGYSTIYQPGETDVFERPVETSGA
ncbi:MAG: GntR family transcriptional regulator [Alphaproteobacteria bacterium]